MREEPVQIPTMERRELPRNFLEVALRQKLDRNPNFTAGSPAGKRAGSDPQEAQARTSVSKKVQRLEDKLKNY